MGSVVKLREGWLAKAATMHAVDFDIGRWSWAFGVFRVLCANDRELRI